MLAGGDEFTFYLETDKKEKVVTTTEFMQYLHRMDDDIVFHVILF